MVETCGSKASVADAGVSSEDHSKKMSFACRGPCAGREELAIKGVNPNTDIPSQ
jgi:hypothetical protein